MVSRRNSGASVASSPHDIPRSSGALRIIATRRPSSLQSGSASWPGRCARPSPASVPGAAAPAVSVRSISPPRRGLRVLAKAHSNRRPAACRVRLGDAAPYGVSGCLGAVLEVKLGADAGYVVGDRVRSQRELLCDLVVASAASQSLEDLELAVGKGRADRPFGSGAGLDRDVLLSDELQKVL